MIFYQYNNCDWSSLAFSLQIKETIADLPLSDTQKFPRLSIPPPPLYRSSPRIYCSRQWGLLTATWVSLTPDSHLNLPTSGEEYPSAIVMNSVCFKHLYCPYLLNNQSRPCCNLKKIENILIFCLENIIVFFNSTKKLI